MLGVHKKSAQRAWSFAVIGLMIWSLFIIRKTVLLFVLALMFSYLLFPLVQFLQRRITRGVRLPALLLLFIGFPFALLTAGIVLRTPFVGELHNLQQQIRDPEFRSNLAQWHVLGMPVGDKIAGAYSLSWVQQQAAGWIPALRNILDRAARDLMNVVLVPVVAFMMLKDGRQICDAILKQIPDGQNGTNLGLRRQMVEDALQDAHVLILEYMQALMVLCFSVLIVFSIALATLRVRYAIILALLAFPLEFIPLIGPLVAGLIVVGVCEFNHYQHLSWVLTFLIVYRLFQDYVLSPQLMNKSVKLHPLLIIFGVFAGGEIGGIGGIFLSVPLLAVVRLLFYERRKLLSREPLVDSGLMDGHSLASAQACADTT